MYRKIFLLTTLAGATACTVESGSGDSDTAAAAPATVQAPATPAPAPIDSAPAMTTLKVEVDTKARRLYVLEGDRRVGEHGVAVGSPEWPTQPGEWSIGQVVWNPEWTPPKDESWAKDEKPTEPGAPDNPLGRVQLVYDPPRTIHGTNEPASIGKAVSHGSIRMTNETAIALAKQLMEASGVAKDEAWYQERQQQRTEKVIVDLPRRVPIRVY